MKNLDDTTRCFRLIQHITAAVGFRQLFFPDHAQVVETIDKAFEELNFLLTTCKSITFARIGQVLTAEGMPLKDGGPVAGKFLQLLRSNGIDGITFIQGISRKEIDAIIDGFASRETKALHSSRHIFFGQIAPENDESFEPGGPADGHQVLDLSEPTRVPLMAEYSSQDLEQLKDAFEELRIKPGSSGIQQLTSAIELFMKGFSSSIHPMMYLGTLKSFDEYTFVHAINVFMLTTSQAEFIGFKGKQLYDIGVASVLHDVGKLFISDDILNKPGALTPEERHIMQTHSMKGARYLMEVSGISRLAPICAMDHHIRYDGTGYPSLKGWKTNIVSQMITISDAFDAMRSRRPYQEPKSQELVIRILREESGTAFNPVLVDNFLNLLGQALIMEKQTSAPCPN